MAGLTIKWCVTGASVIHLTFASTNSASFIEEEDLESEECIGKVNNVGGLALGLRRLQAERMKQQQHQDRYIEQLLGIGTVLMTRGQSG